MDRGGTLHVANGFLPDREGKGGTCFLQEREGKGGTCFLQEREGKGGTCFLQEREGKGRNPGKEVGKDETRGSKNVCQSFCLSRIISGFKD